MALFDTTSFRVTSQGLDILWKKQQIISQNITNKDTPDYKAKYIDFYSVLKDKFLENGKVSKELNLEYKVLEDSNTADQPDGNNVDSDMQQLELARAQFQYSALINQLNGDFDLMKTALKST